MVSPEHIAKAVDALLEVLSTLGVSGTPPAQCAVQAVESARRSRGLPVPSNPVHPI